MWNVTIPGGGILIFWIGGGTGGGIGGACGLSPGGRSGNW